MELISHLDLRPGTGSHLGVQYLADFFNCKKLPKSALELENIMLEATRITGAKVVTTAFHEFNPHGLSGVVVIAESHFAVHTWPEDRTAAVDLFTCSKIDPEPGLHYLEKAFGAKDMRITGVERGVRDDQFFVVKN